MIMDLNLRASRDAIRGCGRARSLVVVEERALDLSSLTGKEKADLLYAPVTRKELFTPTVASMRQKCDMRKKRR